MSKKSKKLKRLRKEKPYDHIDEEELWNLDFTIAKFVLPRLKEFRKCSHGYPAYCKSVEEWYEMIDKMIAAFECIAADKCVLSPEESECVTVGLDLFCRNFTSLWY